jgi:long-chain acyl-CoA synthetase
MVMPSIKELVKHLLYPSSSQPQWQDRTAVIQAGSQGTDDRVITHQQFEEIIDYAQATLAAAGVQKQDKVLLAAPNCAELGAALLAIFRLAAVAVPVDYRMTPGELANVAKQISAKVIVAPAKVLSEISAKLDGTISGEHLIEISRLSLDAAKAAGGAKLSAKNLDEDLDLNAPAFIILTSGTTGIPKGAVHDLGTLALNLKELGDLVSLDETKRGLLPLPLSHIFGFEVFDICIMRGACVIFTDHLSHTSFFTCLAKYKPHILVGVPTIYGALLNLDPKTIGLDNTEVMLSGGAPMPLSLAEEFEKKFGKRLNNGYGSTESKIIALNLDGPHESVGKFVPSAIVEIVNDKDEVLPEGETGQIRISGPCNMKGYLNNQADTDKVLRGNSYYTGDLGRLEKGYLYISGRSKEMIIVAGNKVFPNEVEETLRKNLMVKEVAVFGLPHKQLGQIVKATIVISDDALSKKLEGSEDDIKAARQELISNMKEFCKDNLKRELRPMDWDFLPSSKSLPKTASGKIDKKQLVPA